MTWLARAAIKAQLDDLMGKDRDVPLSANKKASHWSDSEFCHCYLVRFCPHDLFKNTKSDLGVCPKTHDERIQKQFQDDADLGAQYTYSIELLRFLEDMVVKLDRQIERAQDRVMAPKANLNPQQAARVAEILQDVKQLQIEMSNLDEDQFQQSMEMMDRINKLTQEREALESGDPLPKLYGGEKQQSVCVICGAISQSTDNDARLVAHLDGKQHQGFLKIRVAIDQLKTFIDDTRAANPSVTAWRPGQTKIDPSAPAGSMGGGAPPSSSGYGERSRDRDRDDRDRDGRDRRGDDRRGGGGGYDDRRRDDDRRGGGDRYDDRRGGGGDYRRGGGGDRYDDRRRDDRYRRDDRDSRRERDRSPDRGARDSRRERDRSPSRH